MKLGVLGWNYRLTPVELRDKIALSPVQQEEIGVRLRERVPALQELTILSTCNRCEFYFAAQDPEQVSQELMQWLIQRWNEPELALQRYFFQDLEAARHLFRVAASLDSMILGEPQILGQLKDSYQRFDQWNWIGARFHLLFPRAFHAAKRVRTETSISNFAVSISYAAVELAKRIFSDLKQQRVLVIGAGEMAELALQHLRRQGIARVLVTNRTFSSAQELAARYQGEAVRFEELDQHLCQADIVISSTGARHFVLTQSMVRKCLRNRRGRSMFFIDIAVPRDIEPEINELPGAYCYDIDDLQNVVERNQQERERQAEQAGEILEQEIERVQDWFRTRSAVPTIRQLRQNFHEAGQQELAKALRRLPNLNEAEQEVVTRLVHNLVNKLLHVPTTNLRELGRLEDSAPQLQALQEIFAIPDQGSQESTPAKVPPLKLVHGARS